MHFFYLDESGCTGNNLQDPDQPIFAIGGLTVSDERWRTTTDAIEVVVSRFFNGEIPADFELHAHELISMTGPFASRTREECNAFAHSLLDALIELKHQLNFIAIDKAKLDANGTGNEHATINCRAPYLLGFNYLVTAIERYVKHNLGKSARGMIILDDKELYQSDIDRLVKYRRVEVPAVRQLKRLVEFSYPVNSKRHPLIQMSDLVVYLVKKFLETENGYRPGWKPEARNFFGHCYDKICSKVYRTSLIDVEGSEETKAHDLLKLCQSTHRPQWRKHYEF